MLFSSDGGKRNSKTLRKTLTGDFETTVELKTKEADVIVTATSHPDALLQPEHLAKDAIIVDVSQPPNLSYEVCQQRPDIHRIDGGLVDFPVQIVIPGMPPGKNFACIAEVIMQAMENERKNHVGSIDLISSTNNRTMGKEIWVYFEGINEFWENSKS